MEVVTTTKDTEAIAMLLEGGGAFDAAILAQLAPLCENECYQPKIYRAPAVSNEVVPANGGVSFTLKNPAPVSACH